jgi:hypothetical protein
MRLGLLTLLLPAALAAQSPAVVAALATGTYFPLDVGDRWVYRIDDRAVTASYQTWRIDRTAMSGGLTYSVMAIEGPGTIYAEYWFRGDGTGKVYELGPTGDILFLDPSGQSPATLQLAHAAGTGGSYTTAIGTFPDTLAYTNMINGLNLENGILARGVGLLTSTTLMLTGSSGGFTQGRTLVEATVAGIRFPAAVPAVKLGIESLTLDVSGQHVTNCAVPCYFPACGLAPPGYDPPGTYKPCAQARVELANWPAGASRAVRLQLVTPGGTAAFDQTLTLDASPTESVIFVQVPLYSAPNQPLPAGVYHLLASTADGVAQSSLAVTVR